jgi:flagellar basal body-associated protein FliL
MNSLSFKKILIIYLAIFLFQCFASFVFIFFYLGKNVPILRKGYISLNNEEKKEIENINNKRLLVGLIGLPFSLVLTIIFFLIKS